MLITFTSKNARSIDMFEDIALTLIQRMGHSATVPGAILGEDVANYLETLENSLQLDPDSSEESPDDDFIDQPVGLQQRAYPLLELLRYAAKHRQDVMWEKH